MNKSAFTIVELPPSLKFRRANLVPNKNVKQGFTIVELLIVIVVIGILAAITIVSYTGISSKAAVASLQSDLSSASKQLKIYQTLNNGIYPTAIVCPATLSTDICIKPSSDTTFTYSANNSNATPTFNLLATKGSTNYNVTNDSQPSVFTAITGTVSATGTFTLSSDGPYRIYKFTGNGTITTTTPGTAEVLVVGGGGGGSGGGGGAGGYLTGTETLTGTMNVTVGAGGEGHGPEETHQGGMGGDSVFGSRTAKGGSGGSSAWLMYALSGGSGGGASGGDQQDTPGGTGTPGQGNNGGDNGVINGITYPWRGGGGGGGAGTAGVAGQGHYAAGNGGAGLNNDIVLRGTYVGYAGGGGGGSFSNGAGWLVGTASHGGGGGGCWTQNGSAGTINAGGGGGGTGVTKVGGIGGSGIVIIRYLTP